MPVPPSLIKDRNVHGMTVHWVSGERNAWQWWWLRENDPSLLHALTLQRGATPSPASSTVTSVRVDPSSRCVRVVWADGASSQYPFEWLALQAARTPALDLTSRPLALWQNASHFAPSPLLLPTTPTPLHSSPQTERVPVHAYTPSPSPSEVAALLALVQRHGWALVQGLPPHPEATRQYAEQLGYALPSIYGQWWDYVVDAEAVPLGGLVDTAYTAEAIPPHTDGTYMSDAPGLQLFHVLYHTGRGGTNTLVDGFHAMKVLRETNPAAYAALQHHPVEWYHKAELYDLRVWAPVFRCDALGKPLQVRYNELDRAPPPPQWPRRRLEAQRAALRALRAVLEDPAHQVHVQLTPGTLLITNNWRVLHGRHAFSGARRICGTYLARDSWEGRLRALDPSLKHFV